MLAPTAPNIQDISIPAKPDALVRMSVLLADEDVNLAGIGALVEADMALASAVMRAVNSAIYGLRGRVQNVHQAVAYLGTREITGITFEMGLRAAFPPARELEPIWDRAGQRGLLMGRLGQALGLDAWAAHSAGLFEECGKAVLFRHAPQHYPAMLRAAATDLDLCQIEDTAFGISHDALGADLCASWGLGEAAVACVRQHVEVQAMQELDGPPAHLGLQALSIIAKALMCYPEAVDAVAELMATQAGLEPTLVLRATRKVQEQMQQAQSKGL